MMDTDREPDLSGSTEDSALELDDLLNDEQTSNESEESVSEEDTPERHTEDPGTEEATGKHREPQSRSARAVQRAKNEAKEARAERDKVQQELIELLRRSNAPQNTRDVDAERREQDRLANMSEYERLEYRAHKDRQDTQAQLQRLGLMIEIQNDKAAFEGIVANRPEFKKYSGRVEEKFQALLNAGAPQPRAAILRNMLGEVILARGGKALSTARKESAENIRRETTRPANARSNVSPTGSSSGDDVERRLRRFHEQGGYL